eukprot:PhM_4_TR15918/c0_g1_i1/m.89212
MLLPRRSVFGEQSPDLEASIMHHRLQRLSSPRGGQEEQQLLSASASALASINSPKFMSSSLNPEVYLALSTNSNSNDNNKNSQTNATILFPIARTADVGTFHISDNAMSKFGPFRSGDLVQFEQTKSKLLQSMNVSMMEASTTSTSSVKTLHATIIGVRNGFLWRQLEDTYGAEPFSAYDAASLQTKYKLLKTGTRVLTPRVYKPREDLKAAAARAAEEAVAAARAAEKLPFRYPFGPELTVQVFDIHPTAMDPLGFTDGDRVLLSDGMTAIVVGASKGQLLIHGESHTFPRFCRLDEIVRTLGTGAKPRDYKPSGEHTKVCYNDVEYDISDLMMRRLKYPHGTRLLHNSGPYKFRVSTLLGTLTKSGDVFIVLDHSPAKPICLGYRTWKELEAEHGLQVIGLHCGRIRPPPIAEMHRFPLEYGVVGHFDVRASVCEAFGGGDSLQHGHAVTFTTGQHYGRVARVVGVRQSRLWAVFDWEEGCFPLEPNTYHKNPRPMVPLDVSLKRAEANRAARVTSLSNYIRRPAFFGGLVTLCTSHEECRRFRLVPGQRLVIGMHKDVRNNGTCPHTDAGFIEWGTLLPDGWLSVTVLGVFRHELFVCKHGELSAFPLLGSCEEALRETYVWGIKGYRPLQSHVYDPFRIERLVDDKIDDDDDAVVDVIGQEKEQQPQRDGDAKTGENEEMGDIVFSPSFTEVSTFNDPNIKVVSDISGKKIAVDVSSASFTAAGCGHLRPDDVVESRQSMLPQSHSVFTAGGQRRRKWSHELVRYHTIVGISGNSMYCLDESREFVRVPSSAFAESKPIPVHELPEHFLTNREKLVNPLIESVEVLNYVPRCARALNERTVAARAKYVTDTQRREMELRFLLLSRSARLSIYEWILSYFDIRLRPFENHDDALAKLIAVEHLVGDMIDVPTPKQWNYVAVKQFAQTERFKRRDIEAEWIHMAETIAFRCRDLIRKQEKTESDEREAALSNTYREDMESFEMMGLPPSLMSSAHKLAINDEMTKLPLSPNLSHIASAEIQKQSFSMSESSFTSSHHAPLRRAVTFFRGRAASGATRTIRDLVSASVTALKNMKESEEAELTQGRHRLIISDTHQTNDLLNTICFNGDDDRQNGDEDDDDNIIASPILSSQKIHMLGDNNSRSFNILKERERLPLINDDELAESVSCVRVPFVYLRNGKPMIFDISPETLAPFGFHHGMRVMYGAGDFKGNFAVILGVGSDGHVWRYDELEDTISPFQSLDKSVLQQRHHLTAHGTVSAVRQADPSFYFHTEDGRVERFDIVSSIMDAQGVAHGQRWYARRGPLAHNMVVIIGVSAGLVWYALDWSGAYPYKDANDATMVQTWDMAFLYCSVVRNIWNSHDRRAKRVRRVVEDYQAKRDAMRMEAEREQQQQQQQQQQHLTPPPQPIIHKRVPFNPTACGIMNLSLSDVNMVFDVTFEACRAFGCLPGQKVRHRPARDGLTVGTMLGVRAGRMFQLSSNGRFIQPIDCAPDELAHSNMELLSWGQLPLRPLPEPPVQRSYVKFITAANTVCMFDIRESHCSSLFGFAHGDRVVYRTATTASACVEVEAVIIGVRGGYLWRKDVTDTFAAPFHGSRGAQGLREMWEVEKIGKAEDGFVECTG